jgi:type IV secretion system protein VirB1
MWIDQIPHCAPTVAVSTMTQVVMVESGGNPLALNVNGLPADHQPHPHTTAEAIAAAQHWIGAGFRVDLGLTQIDSENLPILHLTVSQVLGTDPVTVCANLAAGGMILTADYGRAVTRYGAGQMALAAALSAYNTGDFTQGWANGYVARYFAIPSLSLVNTPRAIPATVRIRPHASDMEVW